MTFPEPARLPVPSLSPAAMVGAASPLWAWFGAATAGGLAYWWLTQWSRPGSVEAMFNAAGLALPTPETLRELAPESPASSVEAAAEANPIVGGESAPVSPLLAEAATLPRVQVQTEAAVAPMAAAAEPEPEPAPKSKKAPPPSPTVN